MIRFAKHISTFLSDKLLERHTFAGEVKAIARASEHVHALLPATGAAINEILTRAQELYERLSPEKPTLAHGDFKADHLWVTPTGLAMIDFDTCCLADPALDVGKFLADLRWWHDVYVQPGVEQAQERFLEGYARRDSEACLARARLYEALILVKITARRVRLFDPGWALRTARLISRAQGLLRPK